MVKTTSTRRVKLGDPEHIITNQQAKKLLANRLKFTPDDQDPRATTHAVLNQKTIEQVQQQFGDTLGNTYANKGLGATADAISEVVIDRLANDQQFKSFTLESVASMTPDVLSTICTSDNDKLSDKLKQQPASNGKIYTTYQLLRTEKSILPAKQAANAADYMLKDARYARSWAKGNFNLTVPRGNDVKTTAIQDAFSAFGKADTQIQDFVTSIYSKTGNSKLLDERLDKINEPNNATLVRKTLGQLTQQDIEGLQNQFRQPTTETLISDMAQTTDLFEATDLKTNQPLDAAAALNQNVNQMLEAEKQWRNAHMQRSDQIHLAINAVNALSAEDQDVLKQHYGVTDTFDLIDTIGDYDELFEAPNVSYPINSEADALKANLQNELAEAKDEFKTNHKTYQQSDNQVERDIYGNEPQHGTVIDGNGPHGTNPEYDFEENESLADGLSDLSNLDTLSHDEPQQ